MDRNAPCWCLSGKKWKRCHKDRHLQTPPPIGQVFHNLHEEMQKGYCSYPDAGPHSCSDRIVRAHTIQRENGLSAIAENGHVISVSAAFENLPKTEGNLIPREVGIRGASTFMGFCNRHDTEMFRPAEAQGAQLTSEVCFLLSFRALAAEIFEKKATIRQMDIQRDMDKGQPFEVQSVIQQNLHSYHEGMLIVLRDLERWKSTYDNAYIDHTFASFQYLGIAFDGLLPVVRCGEFYPEVDFHGRILQKLGRNDLQCEHVTYNLTALNGRSIAVLGWTEGNHGPAAAFVRSFASIDNTSIADAAVRLAFEHIGNTYMKPSWWRALPKSAKEAAIARMPSGGAIMPRRRDCLVADGHVYASGVRVAERLGNGCGSQ